MAWIAYFSRKILCTLANMCVAVVGSTALVLVANERLEQHPPSSKAETMRKTTRTAPGRLFVSCTDQDYWKRTILQGVGLGVGMVLLVAGVVRQATLERRVLKEWFVAARIPRDRLHPGTSSGSPVLRFAGYIVLMGTLDAILNSSNDNNNIDDDDGVNNDQDEEEDDDDIYVPFSTTSVIRPMEDDSDGAERPTRGDDKTFIIRTDTMVTIRDVLASTREIGISDIGILVEEQTNNQDGDNDGDNDGVSDGDNDGVSDDDYDQLLSAMTSIEHEDSATAPYSDEDIPSQ
jgi:hypothetical protein